MEVLSLLAQSYEHSDPNLARKHASKITAKKKVSFEIQARAYNTLANCALLEGDLDEAESLYLKAIELVLQGERVWFSAVYQSSLAQVYLNRGELKKAVFTYQEAQRTLEVADHEQVPFYLSQIYGGLGDVYNQLGLYDMALIQLYESLKIIETLNDDISLGITYNSMAAVYDNLNQPKLSKENNLKALSYFQKAEYPLAEATVLLNLAQNEFKLKKNKQAFAYVNQAERILVESGTNYNLPDVKLLQGELFAIEQKYDLSKQKYIEALSLFETMGNYFGVARAKVNLGSVLFLQLNRVEAYRYLNEALSYFTEEALLKDKKVTLEKLLEFALEDKNFGLAQQYLEALKATEKEFLNDERMKAIAAQEVLYETEKKEIQIAEQALVIEQERNAKLYAYFGIVLFLIFAIGFGLWTRNRRKRQHLEVMNSLMVMKTNIVQKELEQLNKQLDPHEIKNLLASISPEIQEKAPETYRKMLKLLNIVKSSLSGKITQSLEEQINQVRDFLTLEQANFVVPFEFEIKRKVQSSDVAIPRLLLKNLVENSVKHGIKNLSHHGRIEIEIRENSKMLHIAVRDNGIGRKQAIKNDSGIGTITYQRLFELLNLRNVQKSRFEIMDAEKGTVVEVDIPIDYKYD